MIKLIITASKTINDIKKIVERSGTQKMVKVNIAHHQTLNMPIIILPVTI